MLIRRLEFVTLALVLLTAPAGILAKPPKRTPCAGGRFVVQGGPLLPGAPISQVDTLTIGGAPATAGLSIGCDATHLQGKVTLKAVKRGTKVRALWQGCAGLQGRIRLAGTITNACGKLSATLHSKGFKTVVAALLSTCGDGYKDVAAGEQCDTDGIACADGSLCASDCTCANACNVLSPPGQQGCSTGQKCTWIQVQETPESLGTVGCVADGAVAPGDPCTRGAVAEATGFDNCQAGLICISGKCDDICGFDGSPAAACAAGSSCIRYSGLFANGNDPILAGACSLSCDPLTQLRSDGQPCPAGQGCYLVIDSTVSVGSCSQAGTLLHGQTITGLPFINSCVPGVQVRRKDLSSLQYECGALCKMVDVYQGVNEASEGGMAPYTCASKGAAAPSDPTAGESCRYWWALESFDALSPYSNTVGWCFKHVAFLYDSNGDQQDDAPFPRCVTLTTGDVVPPISNPAGNDALEFWCVAKPVALVTPVARSARRREEKARMFPDRVGNWR